jgi:hypothetical protein
MDVVAASPTMLDEGVSYFGPIQSTQTLTLYQALLAPLKMLNVLLSLLVPVTVHDSTATRTVSLERVVLHLVELPVAHHLQAVARVLPISTGTIRICCGRVEETG